MSKPRSSNQQMYTFPFPPYLAHYLFYCLTNKIVEKGDELHRHMDIDMRSLDGIYIRSQFEKANYPEMKKLEPGFRLTVSIPKYVKAYTRVIEDGQTAELIIPQKTLDIIIAYYETRFRDAMVHFVAGAVFGNKSNRGSIESAVKYWMEVYHLHDAGYTLDQLKKFYQRANCPAKKSVYAKTSKTNPFEILKTPGKPLIDRYIKK